MTRPKEISDLEIAAALGRNGGNVSAAAADLGYHRNAVHHRIKASPVLQEVMADERDRIVDELQDLLLSRARKGDLTALIFSLKTIGRYRGFNERDATVTLRGQVDHTHQLEAKVEAWSGLLADWVSDDDILEGEELPLLDAGVDKPPEASN